MNGNGCEPPLFFVVCTRADLVVDGREQQKRCDAVGLWLSCWNGPTLYTTPKPTSAKTGAGVDNDGGGGGGALQVVVEQVLAFEQQQKAKAASDAAAAGQKKGCILQ